jgi:hypothetical protein
MTNAPRAKGTRWETDVVTWFNRAGYPAVERRALHGSRDIGDLTGLPGFLIGCKAERQHRFSVYMDELQVQKRNLVGGRDVFPFEVVKRPGHGAGRAYVVAELAEFERGVLYPLLECECRT